MPSSLKNTLPFVSPGLTLSQSIYHGGRAMSRDEYAAAFLASREWQPERLTFAREAAGWNQTQLAERLGITSSAISQFESGRTAPGTQTVAKLALALSFPPEFFRKPMRATVDASICLFSSSDASATERRRATRRITIMSWLADELGTKICGWPEVSREVRARVESGLAGPDHLARATRAQLGLEDGPVEDVLEAMESLGILVVGAAGSSAGPFAGWRSDGVAIAVLDPERIAPTSLRYEAARQLGYLLIHSRGSTVPMNEAAKAAEAFALSFLMPASRFAKEYPTPLNWTHLRILKRRWGVSLERMSKRACQLSVISESTYRRRCGELNQRGWRDDEPDEPPPEYPQRIAAAVEEEVESGRTLADLAMALGIHSTMLQSLLVGSRPQPSLVVGF